MGDPLLASFSRMFFIKCVGSVEDINSENTYNSFQEMSTVLQSLSKEKPRTFEKITFEDYIELFKPSVDWLIMMFLKFQTEKVIMKTITSIGYKNNNIVLECFLKFLPANIVSVYTKVIT